MQDDIRFITLKIFIRGQISYWIVFSLLDDYDDNAKQFPTVLEMASFRLVIQPKSFTLRKVSEVAYFRSQRHIQL